MRSAAASTWLPSTRALVACILSVVLPGSGSFYLGRARTAFVALGLGTLGPLAAALLWHAGLLAATATVLAIALLTLAAHGGGAVLAAIEAWQGRSKRAFVPALGYLLLAALLLYASQQAGQRWVMRTFAVATIAMEPALEHGDRVLVRVFPAGHAYRRGSVVAVRVIGVGGDAVQIRDAEVLVNGASLRLAPCDEPALQPCHVEQSPDGLRYTVLERVGDGRVDLQVRVPAGAAFVLKDRRDVSVPLDPVPASWLGGEVVDVWWSYTHQGARLDRVGLSVAPREAP
jgi:signal peptidase I